MKKLLTLFCLLGAFCNAQVLTMAVSASNFTNTTAVTATVQVNSASENISIQAIATKSTGTISGTISISASIDGANYVGLVDSLALTDVATQSFIWELTNNNYKYYKVTFQGAGTMNAVPSAYLYSSGASNSRSALNMLSPFSAVSDTTDNTAVSYVTLGLSNWYNTVSIQSVVTKISGTVAGTVTLQGSVDGSNYKTVDSNFANVTSYSPTNVATSTKIFIVTGAPYRYYRLSYAGAGTMSASHRGYVLPNKK